MDFIEQLPMLEGFTAILVVINRLTKQALFIPTHDTIDSPQLTRLFLTHIFAKHGTLGHITLDCGMEFISHFSHSLGKLLGMASLHIWIPSGGQWTNRMNKPSPVHPLGVEAISQAREMQV